MVQVHACLPYNPEFIKNFANENIEFMISIDLFWKVLLTKLRGRIITYKTYKRKRT